MGGFQELVATNDPANDLAEARKLANFTDFRRHGGNVVNVFLAAGDRSPA